MDIVDYPQNYPFFLAFIVDNSVEIVEKRVGKGIPFPGEKGKTHYELEFRLKGSPWDYVKS